MRRQDAEQLAQSRRVRAAGARHARQLPTQQRQSARASAPLDVALSRLVPFGASRTLELRVETFNLLNTFNWGPPALINADRTHVNFSAGAFGRITHDRGRAAHHAVWRLSARF